MNPPVDPEYALNTVLPMYNAARIGPNIPLAALQNGQKYLFCGYGSICFREKKDNLFVQFLKRLLQENDRERLRFTKFVRKDRPEVSDSTDEEAE